jgi:hypothetical protein
MDDDKFKREVLTRLDKIVALLSISCAVSNGSLEKAKAEAAIRQVMGSRQADQQPATPPLVNDEMQEDYQMAMRRWKTDNSASDDPVSGP